MQPDFSLFKQKVPLLIDTDDFIVKTAENKDEILKAQKLRHDIFLEEWQGKTHESGLDFDDYDVIADHLMIIDKKTQEIVGTYRLIHSQFSTKFYSQTEFVLDDFIKIEGSKLEMGRACTHKEYRNGRSMDLLWQGLALYIAKTNTRYLFGCSSVTTNNYSLMFSMAKSIYNDERLKFDYGIRPVPDFTCANEQDLFDKALPLEGYTRQLPALLRSYLQAGSFVYGMPAFDRDFDCFDLFTILDLTVLNKKFKSRYEPSTGWHL